MVFCFSSLLVVTSPHFLALKNYLFYVICLIQAKDVLIYALFSGKIKTIGIIACVKNVKNPKSEKALKVCLQVEDKFWRNPLAYL